MKTNSNFNGSIIAGGNVSRSNNGNNNSYKNNNNIVIKQVRKEAIIISFVVGFLSSLLASYLYEMLF